jgi:hypothetical protein
MMILNLAARTMLEVLVVVYLLALGLHAPDDK